MFDPPKENTDFTPPKTNSSPPKIGRAPKQNIIFQLPTMNFRAFAASFREGSQLTLKLRMFLFKKLLVICEKFRSTGCETNGGFQVM